MPHFIAKLGLPNIFSNWGGQALFSNIPSFQSCFYFVKRQPNLFLFDVNVSTGNIQMERPACCSCELNAIWQQVHSLPCRISFHSPSSCHNTKGRPGAACASRPCVGVTSCKIRSLDQEYFPLVVFHAMIEHNPSQTDYICSTDFL